MAPVMCARFTRLYTVPVISVSRPRPRVGSSRGYFELQLPTVLPVWAPRAAYGGVVMLPTQEPRSPLGRELSGLLVIVALLGLQHPPIDDSQCVKVVGVSGGQAATYSLPILPVVQRALN